MQISHWFSLYSDINECDQLNAGCSHYCNNTDGSYYCSCPVGYGLIDQQLCRGKGCVVLTFNNLEQDVLLKL